MTFFGPPLKLLRPLPAGTPLSLRAMHRRHVIGHESLWLMTVDRLALLPTAGSAA